MAPPTDAVCGTRATTTAPVLSPLQNEIRIQLLPYRSSFEDLNLAKLTKNVAFLIRATCGANVDPTSIDILVTGTPGKFKGSATAKMAVVVHQPDGGFKKIVEGKSGQRYRLHEPIEMIIFDFSDAVDKEINLMLEQVVQETTKAKEDKSEVKGKGFKVNDKAFEDKCEILRNVFKEIKANDKDVKVKNDKVVVMVKESKGMDEEVEVNGGKSEGKADNFKPTYKKVKIVGNDFGIAMPEKEWDDASSSTLSLTGEELEDRLLTDFDDDFEDVGHHQSNMFVKDDVQW